LLPSELSGKIIDFDELDEYVIKDDDFKSWNDDPLFKENGLNAMYFKYTKPCKVEIEFIIEEKGNGTIDVVSWHPEHPQFEVRPVVLSLTRKNQYVRFLLEENDITKFTFYANPLYLELNEGYFEPRVHAGFHEVKEVKISKLLTLKANKECKYALFLLKRAKKLLDFAKEEHASGDHGLSLHFSRFAIELSLKSIYPVFGMTFKYEHDVKFQEDIRKKIQEVIPDFPLSRLLWICQQHVRPARIDFYGDELGFVPSYSFMEKDEARTAINDARYCYEKSTLLLDSVQKEK